MKSAKLKKLIIFLALSVSAIFALTLIGCSVKAYESDGQIKQSSEVIMGSGSSFIYPAISRWSNEYYNQTGIKINYQPIGSGGGQRQIFSGMVNFAASDQPLSSDELSKYHLLQFPVIIGGIVPIVNIEGVATNKLILSGKVMVEIYIGKIKYWNDPAIVALNPKLKLPHNVIITVHRSDASGTTYNFTRYLASIDSLWQNQIGVDTLVRWPIGVGAKGNQGVASKVQQVSDSIGYVEYAYAKIADIPTVKLINQRGKTVSADLNSFETAAKHASWQAKDNYNMLLNQPGKDSWPIVATTFVLLSQNANKCINQEIKQFFSFAYSHKGDKIAKKLDYVAIPQDLISEIKE